MKRLLQFILITPVAVIGLAFAVANRHDVSISFDPFSGGTGGDEIKAPLFIVLILALMCGVLIGGGVTWFAHGRHRRALREARSEAARWRSQAESSQAASSSSPAKFSPLQKEPSATAPGRLLAHS
ncbi:MAG: lipopolysaccharide assembly LapA domain-containing protein [Beijerinckiaceae bacterium]